MRYDGTAYYKTIMSYGKNNDDKFIIDRLCYKCDILSYGGSGKYLFLRKS